MAQLSLQPLDVLSASEPQIFSSFASIAAGLTFNLPQEDVTRRLVAEINSRDIGTSSSALRTIGRGSSFSVSTVATNSSFEPYGTVAFKQCIPLPRGEVNDKAKRRIHNIMLELRVLCHEPIHRQENIVKLLGIAWEADPFILKRRWPVLLLERAPHGTLSDYFESTPSTSFENKVEVSLDIVLGLDALHSCGIFHGDLKMDNILVFDNDNESKLTERPIIAKLADFGGALYDVQRKSFLPTPTRCWAAPDWTDAMTPEQVPKADVYSLGLLVWRIFANGEDPFINGRLDHDHDPIVLQSRVEEVKKSDSAIFNHLRSFRHERTEQQNTLVENFMDYTVRVDSDRRDLIKAQALLQEHVLVPRHPTVSNGLQPHQNLLKNRLIEFSVNGIEMLDPEVVEYIADELIQSIEISLEKNIRHEACFGLAVIYINGFIQAGDPLDTLKTGFNWMQKAALDGNPQAQAFVFRVSDAFGFSISNEVKCNYIIWLSQAVSTGYFTAKEDLTLLGYGPVLQEAEDALRKRYGGTGAKRFPDRNFPKSFPQSLEDYDKVWAKQFSKKPESRGFVYSRFRDRLLHFAACCDLRQTTERLLGTSTDDINGVNEQGETPLLLASRAGNYYIVMLLLEAGANPRIANHFGDLPIHWLLSFERDQAADLCRKILKKGNDLDSIAQDWKYTFTGENAFIKGTPLMRAVSRNRLDIVNILLEAGANPDFVAHKETAISISAFLHYPEILARLLSTFKTKHPEINTRTRESLLTTALRGGSFEASGTLFGRVRRHGRKWKSNARETIDVILQNGGNDHLYDLPGLKGVNALVFAVCFAQPDIVEVLLEERGCRDMISNSSVDPMDPDKSCTPLIMSIWTKKLPIFQTLLQHGADPKAVYEVGDGVPMTALYECARVSNSNIEFARTLIKSGVPVNGSVKNYETPLSCALRRRCFTLAEFLLNNDADLNIEFTNGYQVISGDLPKTVLGHLIQECSISTLGPLEFICNHDHEKRSFLVNKSINFSVLHALAITSPAKQDETAMRMILDVLVDHFEPNQEQFDLRFSAAKKTALNVAALYANVVVVERLLHEGANPDVKDFKGFLPLDIARLCLQEFPQRYKLDDLVVPKARFLRKLRRNAERVQSLLEKTTTVPAHGAYQ